MTDLLEDCWFWYVAGNWGGATVGSALFLSGLRLEVIIEQPVSAGAGSAKGNAAGLQRAGLRRRWRRCWRHSAGGSDLILQHAMSQNSLAFCSVTDEQAGHAILSCDWARKLFDSYIKHTCILVSYISPLFQSDEL